MRRVPQRLATLGIGLAVLAAAGACLSPSTTHQVLRGATMGTTFSVTVVVADDTAVVEHVGALIQNRLDEVEAKMSTYVADSELSRFNRTASSDPFPISTETLTVLQHAHEISELTGGAFDVTVAPLVNAWGFGPSPSEAVMDTLPSEDDLNRLRSAVGYRKLRIDAAHSTIRKTHPDLEIDVSAIAKGYAVDRVAEGLDDAGVMSYLIEIGGEVRTRGRNPDGRMWQVGIERPSPDVPGLLRVVELEDAALATSGDYRNFIEIEIDGGNRRLSHTIDPRSGRPVEHGLASVSIIDSQCARADALATALGVMGPDEAFALAMTQEWAALLVVREDDGAYRELATPAFAALTIPSPAAR